MASEARQQDVEHLMTEVTSLIAAGHARLSAAKLANASGSLLHQVTVALTAVEADVQEAGALAEAGDYQTAQRLLNEAKSRMNLALGSLGQTFGSTRGEDTEPAVHLS
jgi:class 3 adenylate cyclase